MSTLGNTCVKNTLCPAAPACRTHVDESVWKQLAPPAIAEKYSKMLYRSFIDLQSDLKWCPNPKGCERAVKYKGTKTALTCSCGYEFCFLCLKAGHRPASCWEMEAWEKSCAENVDDASVKFMMEHFKKCPKCGNFIEKNQGCKHM